MRVNIESRIIPGKIKPFNGGVRNSFSKKKIIFMYRNNIIMNT